METLTVTNFSGRLTRFNDGDINSDFAKYATTFGNDPYTKPGNLTWLDKPSEITGGVLEDLIVAGKTWQIANTTYVFALGHTGRLYLIKVNDPNTYNPNNDSIGLTAVFSINSPTFKYGSSIEFFNSKVYVGGDKGVSSVNFNGSGEAFVGSQGSYVQNISRPLAQFAGKLYFGNGNNIGEIDSSGVTTYTKLSPSFPNETYVRALEVSPEGNYLQITVSSVPAPDLTSGTPDITPVMAGDSVTFFWNGSDTGYTSFIKQDSYSLSSNESFGSYNYSFGYGLNGTGVYNHADKVLSVPEVTAPSFEGVFSSGNLLGWGAPEKVAGETDLVASVFLYGQYDAETTSGLYRPLRLSATGDETDVVRVPMCLPVSNLVFGSSTSGYSSNIIGVAKLYFTTVETSASTTEYKLYRASLASTGLLDVVEGVYETQTQLFSKKVRISEVRIYGEPWVANNSFTVDLIGSDGNPIPNGSKTFTAGSNLTIGDDFAWYTPVIGPTYALGLRITNSGTANHTITKVEIDYNKGGK